MLEHAKYLLEQGFNIFPLLPNSKDPATPHGFKDATDNIEQFIKLLNGKTDFNIGLAMGNGVIAIDVDPRNGGSETYSEIMVDHEIPDTVRSMTGGELTGMHLFFSVNEEHRCKTQFLPGIDTKGDGGYVVSSPSIHPDTGKRYQWVPGAMPHEVSIKPLPDYLNHKKVGKFALNKEVIQVDNLSFNTADHLKQDVFLPASNGNRNNACTSLAGFLIQQDIKPKVILSMCQSWNRTNPEPLKPNEIKRTVESVFRTHENNHPEVQIIETIPEKLIQNDILKPNLTLEQIKVGGIIQEMCEWMDKCAYRKQPILSFANSIAFFASVIGRNYKLEDDTRSNLYILGISRTGSGKDNSRKRIASLASESKLGYLMGGEDITSGAAILTALDKTSRKTVFFPFDEMGAFLSSKTGRNSSSHQAEIPALLTKLYTSSNSIHFGKQYADEKSRPRAEINQPHVTLYGTSNPVDLFKSVTEDMISSGFFGRMLCFFPKNDRPKANKDSKAHDAPISLISDLNKWANYFIPPPWDRGNLEGILNHYPNIIKISDEAKEVFYNYDELFFKYGQVYKFTKNLDALWVRGVEQAKKLALIFTCSNARVPGIMAPITAQMAEDCCQMIKILIERICIECDQNVIGSDFEALQKKIMDAIRLSGDTGATSSKIFFATRAWKPLDRNNAIQVLIDVGMIMFEKTKINNSRKSTNFYFLRKHNIVDM